MKKFLVLLFHLNLCIAGTIFAQSGEAGPLEWEIVNGVLSIQGEGAMPNYSISNPAPWFNWRNNINKVEIGEGITHIGDSAFYFNYVNLLSITIPSSVKEIGTWAFIGCYNVSEFINTGLEPITVSSATFSGISTGTCTLRVPETSVSKYKDDRWGWGMFVPIEAIDATISFNRQEICIFPVEGVATEEISVILNGDVSNHSLIAWSSSNTDIATVDLSGDVTVISPGKTVITASIGSINASYTLVALAHGGIDGPITWGLLDGVLTIRGAGKIPDYNPIVGSPAPWSNWSANITSVDIGNGITSIGNYAFYDHRMIRSVSIPVSVTEIRFSAFSFFQELTEIYIPATVTTIDPLFLQGSASITNIIVDEANTVFSSVDGVMFSKDMSILLTCPNGKSGSYTIPESVKIIGEFAFDKCTKLTSVILPSNLTSIKSNGFFFCTNLTSITIPATVTEIGIIAFTNCYNLVEFINLNPTPQTSIDNVFDERMFNNCILKVIDAEAYRNATIWKKFQNIEMLDVKIKFDNDDMYLLTGTSEEIAFSVANYLISPDLISWTSKNVSIVTVDPTGTVHAIQPGTTEVKASFGAIYSLCTVTVIGPGKTTIDGNVTNTGNGNVRVNLYIKMKDSSSTKKGIIGGYVLLATTVPNENGEYSFENLPEGLYKIEVEIDDIPSDPSKALPISGNETSLNINITVDSTNAVNFDIPTGTEDYPGINVIIYPNPFTDALHITGVAVETWRAASLQIINIAGMIVHTQTITHPDEIIRLEHLPAGMYIIRIENNGKIMAIHKVVKQ